MKEKGKGWEEKEEKKWANREMGAGNEEENGAEIRDKERKRSLRPWARAMTLIQQQDSLSTWVGEY